jgi:DNA-binding HxlR family transcriptional regulator
VIFAAVSIGWAMQDKPTDYSCAAAQAVELIRGKRRIEILCAMRKGPVRLGQLSRLIPGVSKKVLTENLRKMEASGLVVRTDLGGQVRRVEYELSGAIKNETHDLLDGLEKWSNVFKEKIVPHPRIQT